MLKVQADRLADAVVLHLKGHIVRGPETETLRDAVFSQDKASVITLDLSQVALLDAGGLSVLLELREWTHANRIEFKLANLTEHVQHVFAITHLNSIFDISLQNTHSDAPEAGPVIVGASPRPMEHRN